MNDDVRSVLEFWFGDLGDDDSYPKTLARKWFMKSEENDRHIDETFGALVEKAGRDELDSWMSEPESCLALIVLLDQFTRNIYRGSGKMFAYDAKALSVAKHAVSQGFDSTLHPVQALFIYMPYEHAEDLALQELMLVFTRMLTKRVSEDARGQYRGFIDYAISHHDMIARFGRFPHRNELLDRESTPAELAFLKLPGSSF